MKLRKKMIFSLAVCAAVCIALFVPMFWGKIRLINEYNRLVKNEVFYSYLQQSPSKDRLESKHLNEGNTVPVGYAKFYCPIKMINRILVCKNNIIKVESHVADICLFPPISCENYPTKLLQYAESINEEYHQYILGQISMMEFSPLEPKSGKLVLQEREKTVPVKKLDCRLKMYPHETFAEIMKLRPKSRWKLLLLNKDDLSLFVYKSQWKVYWFNNAVISFVETDNGITCRVSRKKEEPIVVLEIQDTIKKIEQKVEISWRDNEPNDTFLEDFIKSYNYDVREIPFDSEEKLELIKSGLDMFSGHEVVEFSKREE